jgi:hypothetical protein
MSPKGQRGKSREGARVTEQLAAAAKEKLARLAGRAGEGDWLAARELYSCATLVTYWLNFAAARKRQLFKQIAREKMVWPVEYSRHHEVRRAADALMKELEIGDASGINISGVGKSFSWHTPAVEIAYHFVRLVRLVQSHSITNVGLNNAADLSPLAALKVGCKSARCHVYDDKYAKQLRDLEDWGQKGPGSTLPPLSRDTAAQWTKAIGEPFRIIFGLDYERHFRLADLRASVEGRWAGGLGKLRSRMLNAVRQAIRSIAPLN